MGTISDCVLRRKAWRLSAFVCTALLTGAPVAAAGDRDTPEAPNQRPGGVLAQQLGPALSGGLPSFGSVLQTAPEQFGDVVQETIEPQSWEPVGGAGVLRFWPPQQGQLNQGFPLQPFGQIPPQAGMAGQPVAPGIGSGVPGLAGPVGDHGERLVEIIEATIAPNSWDTLGGPGAIRYWAPRHVLVIRASGSTHQQLGDLIGQLRRAN